MTHSSGAQQATATFEQNPFLPPLPVDWEDLGTRENQCPKCGCTYYRRFSISPTKIVHNERTHCACTMEDVNRIEEEARKYQEYRDEAAKRVLQKDLNRYFGEFDLLRDPDCKNMLLETYEPGHKSQEEALSFLKRFDGTGRRKICLQGHPGRGKTHLGIGVLRSLKDQGYMVLALKTIDVLNRLRQGYGKQKDTDKLTDLLVKVDCLLLDDIGVGNTTEWVEGKLYEIIDSRRVGKITVFTTNFTEEELEKRISPRVTSRVMDEKDGKVFYIQGYDRRRNTDLWADVGTDIKPQGGKI